MRVSLFLCAAMAALLASPVMAFDPPIGSAGPLTVRIEGPTEVTRVGVPLPVTVRIENSSSGALSGDVRLVVIDGWQVEPRGAVPFKLEASGKGQVEIKLKAAEGTHDALYPIHAFAAFNLDGRRQEAHAVLITEAKGLAAPRRADVEFSPVAIAPDSRLALWRLPIRRVVFQLPGERAEAKSPGWAGMDARTRGAVAFGQRERRGDVRDAIAIHPPWSPKAGTAIVEFLLRLPPGEPVRLRFGMAIRDHVPARGESPSDGVTFRVRAVPFDAPVGEVGPVVFEKHTDAKIWQDAEADLDRFAGQTVRLQIESHPGPRNNTNCDQSYWAEPMLVVGSPPVRSLMPVPPPAGTASRVLGDVEAGGARFQVRLWPGYRGLLDAVVGFEQGNRRLFVRGFSLKALDEPLGADGSTIVLVGCEEEQSGPGYRVRHRFSGYDGKFDVVGELAIEDGVLRVRLAIENAPPPRPWRVTWLQDAAVTAWSEKARRVYAGQGNVIEDPRAFELPFDGHRLSTSFVGFDFEGGVSLVQGVDVPPSDLEVDPDRKHYSIHAAHAQTITLIPATNVWAGVRRWHDVNGLRPAGGVPKLAGRFVFDLWGGRYAQSADALARAFRYGLTDSVVVWHNWQRWGYDNRLPDIYPPNSRLGTADEFATLVKTCKDAGVLFAPHDNYIDYYPDATGYSYEHIAFHQDGRPVKAWFNPGPKAQSYRWRSDHIRPVLEHNLKLIRDAFAPTAYFIDVWSSIGPYDSWTLDGLFQDRVYTRNTWGSFFSWIRDYLGGDAPQISESGHDQLIGWLDGAQTNHLRIEAPPADKFEWMVWPVGCEDWERIPWFDAAHHDRFVQHGAGYENRYVAKLDRAAHGIYSDDYISTEVLTGHPAMVPVAFGRDAVRVYWLTHDLMRVLALRRIETVEFVGGDIHRQRVRWEGGGEVWVNRGTADWQVGGHTLAQYGFYAEAVTEKGIVSACVERAGGQVVEWSRSPTSAYLGPRGAAQISIQGVPGVSAEGACRFSVEKRGLRVTALPDGGEHAVRIAWGKLSWTLPPASKIAQLNEAGEVMGTEPLTVEEGVAVIHCRPGVFAWELSAE